MKILKTMLAATLFLSVADAALAAPLTYSFTATNFQSHSGNPVPYDSVVGSFTLDGDAVTQINLTIGSHSYSVGDVVFEYAFLGGGNAGANGLVSGDNDFMYSVGYVVWPSTPSFHSFSYSTAGVSDYYSSTTGTLTVVTPAAVPVPSAAYLFGSGLFSLLGFLRNRKSA